MRKLNSAQSLRCFSGCWRSCTCVDTGASSSSFWRLAMRIFAKLLVPKDLSGKPNCTVANLLYSRNCYALQIAIFLLYCCPEGPLPGINGKAHKASQEIIRHELSRGLTARICWRSLRPLFWARRLQEPGNCRSCQEELSEKDVPQRFGRTASGSRRTLESQPHFHTCCST